MLLKLLALNLAPDALKLVPLSSSADQIASWSAACSFAVFAEVKFAAKILPANPSPVPSPVLRMDLL